MLVNVKVTGGLNGFLIFTARPEGEVTLVKMEEEERIKRFCFHIAAQFISSAGNVLILSKPAESMERGEEIISLLSAQTTQRAG